MSFYLSQVISQFLLPAALFALLWAPVRHRHYSWQFWLLPGALGTGILAFAYLGDSQAGLLAVAGAYALVLILLLIQSLLFPVRDRGRWLLVWQALVLALTSFMWARTANLEMLSATRVINTELVLNVFALLAGFLLLAFVQVMTTLAMAGRRLWQQRVGLLMLVVMALLPLSGELILSAMKLSLLEVSSRLIAYVSWVTNFYWVYAYGVILLLLLCLGQLYPGDLRRLKNQVNAAATAIERRKCQARLNRRRTLACGLAVGLMLALFSLLYWDLVASRPPQRSSATRLALSADRQVHLPITPELMDGRLHRFEWLASDGKVVRFFVIDRYPGQGKFAVVFDACMLCGDTGYIQSGNQVVCLACGVRIYIPSIGKPGGCNPVVMPGWQQGEGEILVSGKILESGLKYFTDVVEVTVTDPVNGKALSNTGAEYSYLFAGKTYFFTSVDSYEAFRADPWRYIEVEGK